MLDMIYSQNGSVNETMKRIVIFTCYQISAFVVIVLLGRIKKLQREYVKRLELLFMIILGGLYFILKWNTVTAFIFTCIVVLLTGCCYYIKSGEGVGKVKYKVKYKGYIYSVNVLDKWKIEWIKCVLVIKRIKRRIILFIPENIALYILLTLCWMVFGVISYFLGVRYKNPDSYTIIDVVWELKNSYFTSVILALLIAGYSQNLGHKRKLEIQHNFYVDTMREFENLFQPFVKNELCYYMPFYNSICLGDTLQFVEQCEEKDFKDAVVEFKMSLKSILSWLDEVDREMRDDNIIGMHKQRLGADIQYAKILINHGLREIMNFKQVKDAMRSISDLLFRIVADIRRPWRWDAENNEKILRLLAGYEENHIEDEFYFHMHLYGHKFEIKNK